MFLQCLGFEYDIKPGTWPPCTKEPVPSIRVRVGNSLSMPVYIIHPIHEHQSTIYCVGSAALPVAATLYSLYKPTFSGKFPALPDAY